MKRRDHSRKIRTRPYFITDADTSLILAKENLGTYAKLTSSEKLTGKSEAEDEEVYVSADNAGGHILTGNFKDFKDFPKTRSNVGVIGHKQPLTEGTIKNLKDFSKTNDHQTFFGRVYFASDEGIRLVKKL